MLVVKAVSIAVFMDRDAVESMNVVRRREGYLVVNSAPDVIAAEHLEAGGLGILTIFDQPEPSALVEADRQGLRDFGLGEKEVEFEILGNVELSQRFLRSERVAAIDLRRLCLDGRIRE